MVVARLHQGLKGVGFTGIGGPGVLGFFDVLGCRIWGLGFRLWDSGLGCQTLRLQLRAKARLQAQSEASLSAESPS